MIQFLLRLHTLSLRVFSFNTIRHAQIQTRQPSMLCSVTIDFETRYFVLYNMCIAQTRIKKKNLG